MELIDRDALIAEYDRVHIGPPGDARRLMEEAPAVDAVPVIRCKDCKHMQMLDRGYRYCMVWRAVNSLGDEGWCDYGVRKDNG